MKKKYQMYDENEPVFFQLSQLNAKYLGDIPPANHKILFSLIHECRFTGMEVYNKHDRQYFIERLTVDKAYAELGLEEEGKSVTFDKSTVYEALSRFIDAGLIIMDKKRGVVLNPHIFSWDKHYQIRDARKKYKFKPIKKTAMAEAEFQYSLRTSNRKKRFKVRVPQKYPVRVIKNAKYYGRQWKFIKIYSWCDNSEWNEESSKYEYIFYPADYHDLLTRCGISILYSIFDLLDYDKELSWFNSNFIADMAWLEGIANEYGYSPGTVRKEFQKMQRYGFIRKVNTNYYQLNPFYFGFGDWKATHPARKEFFDAMSGDIRIYDRKTKEETQK